MEKKTRNLIFILGLILFFIIAPLLLLYSQGIKISFGQKKILRTGGFYLNVWQNSAEIYLNGTLQKKTGVLTNSVLIRNLSPEEYQIEVKKEGYLPWQKTLEIKEGEVISAKNILLVKESPQFKSLKDNVSHFLISDDGKELLAKEEAEGDWRFSIFNLSTLQEREVISAKDLKGSFELEPLTWNYQNKEILFEDKKNQMFFVLDYQLPPEGQIFNLNFLTEVKEISFNPQVKGEVLCLQGNNLVKKNFKENKKGEIFIPQVLWFSIQDGNLFWLSDSGFLLKADLNGENREILNKEPFLVKRGEDYQIKLWQGKMLVSASDGFYLLQEDGQFNKIFEKIEGFEIAPDSGRVAFWSKNEIWLLREIRGKRESLFLNRFSGTPQTILWLTPYYLMFKTGHEIKITEIDNRDYLNMVNLATFKNPEIFFNQGDEKLYILTENTLYLSEKLVP